MRLSRCQRFDLIGVSIVVDYVGTVHPRRSICEDCCSGLVSMIDLGLRWRREGTHSINIYRRLASFLKALFHAFQCGSGSIEVVHIGLSIVSERL